MVDAATAEAGGPEVPFPLKIVQEVMCRDCPFPAEQMGLSAEQTTAAGAWIKQVLEMLSPGGGKVGIEPTWGLKGHKLRVIHPGQAVTMEYVAGRVNITVDATGVIIEVSIG